MPTKYQLGLPEGRLDAAALLYEEAFGAKFAPAIGDVDARLSMTKAAMKPDYAFVALLDGELVGIVGLQTQKGAFMDVKYSDLTARLGWFSGSWAALILSLYERKAMSSELLIDSIAVRADMRGQGVGSGLLDAVVQYASEAGFSRVCLDVIDSNPEARKLYSRKGFEETRTERFLWLKWLLGFGAATTMCLILPSKNRPTRPSR